jgi:hypothetical protein
LLEFDAAVHVVDEVNDVARRRAGAMLRYQQRDMRPTPPQRGLHLQIEGSGADAASRHLPYRTFGGTELKPGLIDALDDLKAESAVQFP